MIRVGGSVLSYCFALVLCSRARPPERLFMLSDQFIQWRVMLAIGLLREQGAYAGNDEG